MFDKLQFVETVWKISVSDKLKFIELTKRIFLFVLPFTDLTQMIQFNLQAVYFCLKAS